MGKLIRTIKLAGTIPANTCLRVASGAVQPDAGGFSVDGGLHVAVTGAQVAGRNLLVPARAEIKITYTWPARVNALASPADDRTTGDLEPRDLRVTLASESVMCGMVLRTDGQERLTTPSSATAECGAAPAW